MRQCVTYELRKTLKKEPSGELRSKVRIRERIQESATR